MERISAPPVSLLDRYEGSEFLPLYSTSVTVVGGEAAHARSSGHARSADGELDLQLRLPAELGGRGGGTNPEQLFAAGYAACFHGALTLVAAKRRIRLPSDLAIVANVAFGRDPADGLFQIKLALEVKLPGVAQSDAQTLVAETEKICPYAKMGRSGIDQIITVVGA
jgi:lipoyl-dependent peroxiredoxin